MTDKNMQRCTTSLATREMSTETIIKYNHDYKTGNIIMIIIIATTIQNAGKDIEKVDYVYIGFGDVKWYNHSRKLFGTLSYKLNIQSPHNGAIVLKSIYPREMKSVHSQQYLYLNIIAALLIIPPKSPIILQHIHD